MRTGLVLSLIFKHTLQNVNTKAEEIIGFAWLDWTSLTIISKREPCEPVWIILIQ